MPSWLVFSAQSWCCWLWSWLGPGQVWAGLQACWGVFPGAGVPVWTLGEPDHRARHLPFPPGTFAVPKSPQSTSVNSSYQLLNTYCILSTGRGVLTDIVHLPHGPTISVEYVHNIAVGRGKCPVPGNTTSNWQGLDLNHEYAFQTHLSVFCHPVGPPKCQIQGMDK